MQIRTEGWAWPEAYKGAPVSDQKQRIRRNRIVMSCLLEESEDAKLTGKENFFFPLEKVLCRAVSRRERET